MKRIIISLMTVFITVSLYSQQITLDFCVGTWKYTNSTTGEEFVMKLKKYTYQVPRGFGGGIKECLVGGYIHKKNGIVQVDCMQELEKNQNAISFPILIFYFISNINYLDITIKDFILKNGYGHPKVIGMPSKIYLYFSSPKQIKIELAPDQQEELYLDPREVFPRGTSLPLEMILTKIE